MSVVKSKQVVNLSHCIKKSFKCEIYDTYKIFWTSLLDDKKKHFTVFIWSPKQLDATSIIVNFVLESFHTEVNTTWIIADETF